MTSTRSLVQNLKRITIFNRIDFSFTELICIFKLFNSVVYNFVDLRSNFGGYLPRARSQVLPIIFLIFQQSYLLHDYFFHFVICFLAAAQVLLNLCLDGLDLVVLIFLDLL